MSAPDESFVRLTDLAKEFDVSPPFLNRVLEGQPKVFLKAVDGVSFDIPRGKTFSLVGESGCGKSTVARLVVGLYSPTRGSILFDGNDLSKLTTRAEIEPVRKRLQMIFQDPYASLNPRWRVSDIIAEPIRVHRLIDGRAAIAKRVGELLTYVGLAPADGTKFPHEFSGGQRQRISIARALASQPEFLVCDEPTSALDVSVQAQILNLMKDLQREFGLTYLFISHDLAVVSHISDFVGVMYLGRLVEWSDARTIFKAPRHPYTRMLLDAIPDLDMTGRQRIPVAGEVPNAINPPPGCHFHPRCPYSNDRCREEAPRLVQVDNTEVACHAVEEGRLPDPGIAFMTADAPGDLIEEILPVAFLTTDVYEHRLRELRALMEREHLDVVALTGADFYQYASNYHLDVRTWERPVLLVVPREGEPFTILNSLSTNHFKMACERATMWVTDAVFYYEHPVARSNAYHVHEFPKLVADVLSGHGLADARIGWDSAPAQFEKTREILPTLEARSVAAQLRELRWVKHPEELAIMRELASLSDWLQDRYRENIRPGRLLQELDRSMAALMFEEGARRFPGENLEMLACYTLSGPSSASPHGNGAQTGAAIETGDGLVNILVPRLNGLVVENERTWFCSKPTPEQTKLFETARAANEAAIEAIVTDRPVSGIDQAAREVIEGAGFGDHILHRTGHGIGILGHEFPEDMAFNDRPLIAGEVYSAEPGIYVYGLGGFRFDDTVVVGDQPDVLTRAPKDLASQTVQ